MSDAQYLTAIEVAKRFIEAAEAARAIRATGRWKGATEHMVTGTKECGAAKRASMDLTRALARFRRGAA